MSENPYAATTIALAEDLWPSEHEGVVVINGTTMTDGIWQLTFGRQSVSLLNHEGVVCKSTDKAKFIKEFSFTPIGVRCLILKIEGKKRVIKLTEEQVIEIIRLLGVEEWKQVYGKIGAKAMLGWGIVLLLIAGLVSAGTKTWSTQLIALEFLWISAGIIMITNGVLAKKRPRALNYALQMGSSGLIIGCIVIGMLSNFSYFQIFFLFILLVGIPIALHNYKLFKKIEAAT